ncbi:uncharacterized protein [Spinacia oleracea]|uniref:Reverse transcriptase domain-containing protein n=1 Tax=Spinacia oleracea TaxID=3562 RepID=A0ABM3R8V9_SPIOL|nr:uncharacterized protein LOC110790773 [Spinacia oleracea]
MVGHMASYCRQGNTKKGFQRALRPIRVRNSPVIPTQTTNTFHLLETEVQNEAGNRNETENEVKHFIHKYEVGLVGLLEHKVKLPNLGKLYQKVFSNWCFTNNSSYHSGGRIVVAWKSGCFIVNIVAASSQFLHCHITLVGGMPSFHCIFVYAFNDHSLRQELWRNFNILNVQSPWILCGVFNCVMVVDERIGAPVRHADMVDINNCMHVCGMEDIGNLYTWNNKQQGTDRVFSKLDRVLANYAWQGCYPSAEACFMPEGQFDHSPGLMAVYRRIGGGRKPFKYFTMWKTSPVFNDIIHAAWNTQISGSKMFIVVTKLKKVKATDLSAYQAMIAAQEAMHSTPTYQSLADMELQAIQELYNLVMSAKIITWAILNAPYTAEEVKVDLFSIPGVKALGPDGFGSYFYKGSWHIVGDEVIANVLDVFQHGKLLKEANHTVVTLIPKTKCPKNDLVRHYGRKGVKPSCLMKIDLQKAYDTVDWQFLKEMKEYLEFPTQFVDIVMECVTTPKFSVTINGSMHGLFKSHRGLRQGDLLSPLPFVICMEYFSRILHNMSDLPQFQFHPRCKDTRLTHFCFPDDLILCCKDSSGLKANQKKSSIFCHGMAESEVQRVVEVSGFTKSVFPFKYLGVPICSKRIYVAQCGVLVDKMTAVIKIAFLWSGHAYCHRPSNISWEKVYCDKQTGGLGFKDVLLWNVANMGKYVWALVTKQDNVWIKWVTLVYLKNGVWWDYL